ncbi:hypothetical protein CRUP_016802 [Coryphaenoides rupestris]|nr:hypothetical protein CRUP_016802 [Coryphaenoides rupestris]
MEQMNGLFQQKQRELAVAASRVDDLSRQLDMLKNGKMDAFHDNQGSLRNKLNQEQSSKLQQQRDGLNKRNQEVAAMDKRLGELRERLWKKKAALQHKENVPNGVKERPSRDAPHSSRPRAPRGSSRGRPAWRQWAPTSSPPPSPGGLPGTTSPVKPAHPDSTATLPAPDPQGKTGPEAMFLLKPLKELRAKRKGLQTPPLAEWGPGAPQPNGLASTLPRMAHAETDDLELKRDRKVRPVSMFEATEPPPPAGLRRNPSTDDLVRDAQASKPPVKVPPPVPTKPKGPNGAPYGKGPGLHTGTFPKAKPASSASSAPAPPPGRLPLPASHSQTLPLPSKQEAVPPAAAVRPFTPELPPSKPQTLAGSSIYSMYTQQPGAAKPFQPSVQGALSRAQTRVYGKPVLVGVGSLYPENPYLEPRLSDQEVDYAVPGPEGPPAEVERAPRPLSPTKLLPFISNPYRQSDGDLEALRKRLSNAPRALKKRSSITEPEGPAGPNIQKLLYQKTTLAAMETLVAPPLGEGGGGAVPPGPFSQPERGEPRPEEEEPTPAPHFPPSAAPVPPAEQSRPRPLPEDFITPPPPPAHPAPRPDETLFPPPPPGPLEEEPAGPLPPLPPEGLPGGVPPLPPAPLPERGEQEGLADDSFSMKAPEVTGQASKPPVKVPPPVPTKPKGPNGAPYGKGPGLHTGTFPKAKPASSASSAPAPPPGRLPLPASHSQTLPLPSKQEAVPPAAAVRPFTPELPPSKPQTLAGSSIYSMYTQQPGAAKPFQPSVQGALSRAQTRATTCGGYESI